MSRNVRLDRKLSVDDKAYLFQMNRHADIAENEERFPEDEEAQEEGSEEGDAGNASDPAVLTDADEDGEPYSEWTVAELMAELVERKLPKTGTKTELVARLEANDEESDEG